MRRLRLPGAKRVYRALKRMIRQFQKFQVGHNPRDASEAPFRAALPDLLPEPIHLDLLAARCQADITLAREVLGFIPRFGFEEGVARTTAGAKWAESGRIRSHGIRRCNLFAPPHCKVELAMVDKELWPVRPTLHMNKHLSSLASTLFSPGERSALRRLLTEFRISRYHRDGLRRIRRMSWSRPSKLNLGSGKHRKEDYLNIDLFPGAT